MAVSYHSAFAGTCRDPHVQHLVEELWRDGKRTFEIAEAIGLAETTVRNALYQVGHTVDEVRQRNIVLATRICEHCKEEFTVNLRGHGAHGRARFCSKRCSEDSRKVVVDPEVARENRRKQTAFLAIERRKAADEFFAWLEKEKIRRRARAESYL